MKYLLAFFFCGVILACGETEDSDVPPTISNDGACACLENNEALLIEFLNAEVDTSEMSYTIVTDIISCNYVNGDSKIIANIDAVVLGEVRKSHETEPLMWEHLAEKLPCYKKPNP